VEGKRFTNITREDDAAPAARKWDLTVVLGDVHAVAVKPKLTLSRTLESGTAIEYVGDATRWLANTETRELIPHLAEVLGTDAWDAPVPGTSTPFFRMRIVSKRESHVGPRPARLGVEGGLGVAACHRRHLRARSCTCSR
jgi:hypothetical protein